MNLRANGSERCCYVRLIVVGANDDGALRYRMPATATPDAESSLSHERVRSAYGSWKVELIHQGGDDDSLWHTLKAPRYGTLQQDSAVDVACRLSECPRYHSAIVPAASERSVAWHGIESLASRLKK